MWLGIACAFLGPFLYAAQLGAAARTDTPWYAPVLATIGLALTIVALRRRPTVWRGIAIVFVAAFAVLQWWFLVYYVRLPPYTGPIAVGQPFPDFQARRADGTAFTRADLPAEHGVVRGPQPNIPADRGTVLVFFRGRW
jgi:hypothetical protein